MANQITPVAKLFVIKCDQTETFLLRRKIRYGYTGDIEKDFGLPPRIFDTYRAADICAGWCEDRYSDDFTFTVEPVYIVSQKPVVRVSYPRVQA